MGPGRSKSNPQGGIPRGGDPLLDQFFEVQQQWRKTTGEGNGNGNLGKGEGDVDGLSLLEGWVRLRAVLGEKQQHKIKTEGGRSIVYGRSFRKQDSDRGTHPID